MSWVNTITCDSFFMVTVFWIMKYSKNYSCKSQQEANKVDKIIGSNIFTLRNKRGISKQNLADKIGCEVVKIRRFEEGSDLISVSELIAFADVLDVDLYHLCEGLLARPSEFKPGFSYEILMLCELLELIDDDDAIREILNFIRQFKV